MLYVIHGGDVLYVIHGGDVLYVIHDGDVSYVIHGGDVSYVIHGGDRKQLWRKWSWPAERFDVRDVASIILPLRIHAPL